MRSYVTVNIYDDGIYRVVKHQCRGYNPTFTLYSSIVILGFKFWVTEKQFTDEEKTFDHMDKCKNFDEEFNNESTN